MKKKVKFETHEILVVHFILILICIWHSHEKHKFGYIIVNVNSNGWGKNACKVIMLNLSFILRCYLKPKENIKCYLFLPILILTTLCKSQMTVCETRNHANILILLKIIDVKVKNNP